MTALVSDRLAGGVISAFFEKAWVIVHSAGALGKAWQGSSCTEANSSFVLWSLLWDKRCAGL